MSSAERVQNKHSRCFTTGASRLAGLSATARLALGLMPRLRPAYPSAFPSFSRNPFYRKPIDTLLAVAIVNLAPPESAVYLPRWLRLCLPECSADRHWGGTCPDENNTPKHPPNRHALFPHRQTGK